MVACVSISFLFVAEYHSILWIDYILFIHLSVDGHLDCFHFLATMNSMSNAVTNIHVHVLYEHIFITLGCLYSNSCLMFFEKLPDCFSKWLHHFTFPPAMYEGSNFSTSSPTFVITCLSDSRHPSECEVISYCGFDLHLSDG